jgi:hypothetical protein
MAEQVEEGLTEAGQDEVDLGIQSVCTELGSPSDVSTIAIACTHLTKIECAAARTPLLMTKLSGDKLATIS